jgi:CBS domain-containing protein
MKVRETMAETVTSASPADMVAAAAQAMREEDAGFLPVLDGDRLVGVLTDRDIVVRVVAERADPSEVSVGDVMSTDVQTVAPDDDLSDAAKLMSDGEVRRLPVVEGGRLVGVLSHGNLVQATEGKGPGRTATTGVTQGA